MKAIYTSLPGRFPKWLHDDRYVKRLRDERIRHAYRENTGKEPVPVVAGSQWAYGLPGYGVWTREDRQRLLERTRA